MIALVRSKSIRITVKHMDDSGTSNAFEFRKKTSVIHWYVFSVIYLSLDKTYEALDAYKQALALEPNNENYKQSVKICEDRINAAPGGGAAAAGVGWSFELNLVFKLSLYLGS